MRSRAWAAAAASSFPAATPLSIRDSISWRALSSAAFVVSMRRVSKFPRAATYAMPRPMIPAPRTPTVFTRMEGAARATLELARDAPCGRQRHRREHGLEQIAGQEGQQPAREELRRRHEAREHRQ